MSMLLPFTHNFKLVPNTNIQSTLSILPEHQIYKLHESKSLGDLASVQAVHQENRMAVAYIDTVGTTRATINLYDFNFELIDQLMIDESAIPKLNTGNNGVTNFSNSVVVNNTIVTYFQTDDTTDSSSRHKLLVYDISNLANPLPYLVELVSTGNSIISNNISAEIEYVNNRYYLTIIDLDNNSYTISELTFSLTTISNGYYQGSINYLAGSTSSIIAVTPSSNLDYCQTFLAEQYCYDHAQPNKLYNLNISTIPISQSVFTFNNYYVGIETANNTTKVKVFKTQKNQAGDDLELILIKEFVIQSSYVRLAQVNFVYNRVEVYDSSYKYMIDLNTYELTSVSYDNYETKQILYNQSGKKLELDISGGSLIYATSEFDNLTYVIQSYGFILLGFNYYNDDLLFVAYDNVNQKYFYYAYTISLETSGGTPRTILEFTKEEIRVLLNAALGSQVYANTTNIDLQSFKFYEDELFVVDQGRVVSAAKLNIINFKANNTRFVYLYDQIGLEVPFPPSYRLTTASSGHLNMVVNGVVSGGLGFEAYEIDITKANQLNSSNILSFTTGNDFIGTYVIGNYNYVYQLNKANFTIRILKREAGVVLETIDVKIPKTALKPLINSNYSNLYVDFDTQFPYVFINFAFDENNNLFITDSSNNIHILYGLDIRSNNQVGRISINNQILDNNSTNYELAVLNNVSSLNIMVKSFFERVNILNNSPYSLNEGSNIINITLQALDNTIRNLTFNIFRAPNLSSPPIVLPGLDPNYVPPSSSSSAQSSSSVSSSVISSSISSSYSTSSSSSSNSVVTSSSSSIGSDNPTNNEEENPLFIWIILGIPAIITLIILGYAQILKGRAKSKVKVEDKKDDVEIPNSENKDNL
jgi:hypothetical protein